MEAAIASMTTLNKYAAEVCRKYQVHACTDVTGFSFLGHLHEMMDGRLSCHIHSKAVPVFQEALAYADEFLLTAAGQRNRNYVGAAVHFEQVPFALEEVLFDPQTSGGLLVAADPGDAPALLQELRAAGLPAAIVGEITEKKAIELYID
jgi:selenide,water dikinase